MNKVKVSIIIPVYYSEKYLKENIESLLNQNYKERYEIIYVVFGNVDTSYSIISSYEKMYPDKIRIIFNDRNYGISFSRNIGILASNGEYISFVDSDDSLNKNYLRKMMKVIESNDYDIVTCAYYQNKFFKHFNYSKSSFKGSGKDLLKKQFNGLPLKYRNYCWGRIYKKSLLVDNHIYFDTSLACYEDLLFITEAMYHASKVKYIKTPLYFYRKNHNSTMSTLDSTYENHILALSKAKEYIKTIDEKFADELFTKLSLNLKLQLDYDKKVTNKRKRLLLNKTK